jgi:hypothetical protein
MTEQLLENFGDIALIKKLEGLAGLARRLPFEVNVWRSQDNYYHLLQTVFPEYVAKARSGDTDAIEWVNHFVTLGQNLSVKVDRPHDLPDRRDAA